LLKTECDNVALSQSFASLIIGHHFEHQTLHIESGKKKSSMEYARSKYKPTPKKISSEVDNWYLDEFFEEFICGR
jgi:hypothetical protein